MIENERRGKQVRKTREKGRRDKMNIKKRKMKKIKKRDEIKEKGWRREKGKKNHFLIMILSGRNNKLI